MPEPAKPPNPPLYSAATGAPIPYEQLQEAIKSGDARWGKEDVVPMFSLDDEGKPVRIKVQGEHAWHWIQEKGFFPETPEQTQQLDAIKAKKEYEEEYDSPLAAFGEAAFWGTMPVAARLAGGLAGKISPVTKEDAESFRAEYPSISKAMDYTGGYMQDMIRRQEENPKAALTGHVVSSLPLAVAVPAGAIRAAAPIAAEGLWGRVAATGAIPSASRLAAGLAGEAAIKGTSEFLTLGEHLGAGAGRLLTPSGAGPGLMSSIAGGAVRGSVENALFAAREETYRQLVAGEELSVTKALGSGVEGGVLGGVIGGAFGGAGGLLKKFLGRGGGKVADTYELSRTQIDTARALGMTEKELSAAVGRMGEKEVRGFLDRVLQYPEKFLTKSMDSRLAKMTEHMKNLGATYRGYFKAAGALPQEARDALLTRGTAYLDNLAAKGGAAETGSTILKRDFLDMLEKAKSWEDLIDIERRISETIGNPKQFSTTAAQQEGMGFSSLVRDTGKEFFRKSQGDKIADQMEAVAKEFGDLHQLGSFVVTKGAREPSLIRVQEAGFMIGGAVTGNPLFGLVTGGGRGVFRYFTESPHGTAAMAELRSRIVQQAMGQDKYLSQAAANPATRILEGTGRHGPLGLAKTYKRTRDAVKETSNEEIRAVRAGRMGDVFSAVSPAAAGTAVKVVADDLDWARNRLPPEVGFPARAGEYLGKGVSLTGQAKFTRTMRALEAPAKEAAKVGTKTPPAPELRDVLAERRTAIRDILLSKTLGRQADLRSRGKDLNYESAKQLSRMTDYPLHFSMQGKFIAASQRSHGERKARQVPAVQPQARSPKEARKRVQRFDLDPQSEE